MTYLSEGIAAVRGKSAKDIQAFLLRFWFDDRDKELLTAGLPSDYPSIKDASLTAVKKVLLSEVVSEIFEEEVDKGELSYFCCFPIAFGWTARSSLLDEPLGAYRDKDDVRIPGFISLPEACLEHGVTMEVFAEVLPFNDVEHIIVRDSGEVLINERLSQEESQYLKEYDGSYLANI